MMDVLDRKLELTPNQMDDDPKGREIILFLEKRLAAPHLKYLAEDQVNGIWGPSATQALATLCKNYHIAFDAKTPRIGATILSAILDGTKPSGNIQRDHIDFQVASYEWFKALYDKKGYTFHTQDKFVNLCGIRGFLEGREVTNTPNRYNDTLFIIKSENGKKTVEAFKASVDPGRYFYHVKPMNPVGCAHLEPGQYTYVRGRHITSVSNYEALVQHGPVLVKRSNTGNPPPGAPKERGIFWINIHAGIESEWVEAASAGCQVVYSNGTRGWQWQRFKSEVYRAPNQVFNYALFDSKTDI
jgi:hypothetical protein